MSTFLATLAARSLAGAPAAVRPRLRSRFEPAPLAAVLPRLAAPPLPGGPAERRWPGGRDNPAVAGLATGALDVPAGWGSGGPVPLAGPSVRRGIARPPGSAEAEPAGMTAPRAPDAAAPASPGPPTPAPRHAWEGRPATAVVFPTTAATSTPPSPGGPPGPVPRPGPAEPPGRDRPAEAAAADAGGDWVAPVRAPGSLVPLDTARQPPLGRETRNPTTVVQRAMAQPPSRRGAPVVPARQAEPPVIDRIAAAPPSIAVTIGRVDVRAVLEPEPAARPPAPAPKPLTQSLDDYLSERSGRSR